MKHSHQPKTILPGVVGAGGGCPAQRGVLFFARQTPQAKATTLQAKNPARSRTPPPRRPGPAGDLDLNQIVRTWPAVLDKLRETSPALAATFEGARPVSLDDEGLKVGFPAEFTFNKKKAETPEKRELMADAIEDVLGERLRPVYVLLDGEPAAAEEEAAAEAEIDHDALVEKLKSEFDAEEVG